jgi:deoxyadenosine/deoxycytidine kinase
MSFVNIEGLIASGKSTLIRNLNKKFGYPVFFESVKDNPILEDFYDDMKRHSFHLQIEFLFSRFVQHKQALHLSTLKKNKLVLTDRGLLFDDVFARLTNKSGLMTDKEYDTYINLRNVMLSEVAFPHAIIYLDVDPEVSFERIQQRNRECEKGITLEYLKALHTEYFYMLEELSEYIPILHINYNKFVDEELLNKRILDFLEKNNHNTYFKLTRNIGD